MDASLQKLFKSLPPSPVEQLTLDAAVDKCLETVKKDPWTDSKRMQWELTIRSDAYSLAAKEGAALKSPETSYYGLLRTRLDVILAFHEKDAVDHVFIYNVIQELLEMHTIASCSHIFGWIEDRRKRLTKDIVAGKGKALIILRTLNDLLRRLSKIGSSTEFCGRILTFLTRVFPLDERSGVNLRGDYGPLWQLMEEHTKEKGKEEKDEAEVSEALEKAGDGDAMAVDNPPKPLTAPEDTTNQDFYNVFWSLQRWFSRPPLFASAGELPAFKDAVEKVLPVIKEASAKERTMMGNRQAQGNSTTSASLKRKRDEPPIEDTKSDDYFFAKFLTSPELLSLEVADPHFRRQVLFQLLILLQHLLWFTKSSHATWAQPRNRSLHMDDFTLSTTDQQWVNDMIVRTTEELRASGRPFAETTRQVLERENNWVKWKNGLCQPFDKPRWYPEGDDKKSSLEEATRDVRKKMREDPQPWKHQLGSQPLTEIWALGYRGLRDLEDPVEPPPLKEYVRLVKQQDGFIEKRRKMLQKKAELVAPTPEPIAADAMTVDSSAASPGAPLPDTHPGAGQASANAGVKADQDNNAKVGVPNSTAATTNLPAPENQREPKIEVTSPDVSMEAPPSESKASDAPVPTPPSRAPPDPFANDPIIRKHEETKQRYSWLALRRTRDQHLGLFGKIGTGDIVALEQEIEKEKAEEAERKDKPALRSEDKGDVATAEGAGVGHAMSEDAATSAPSTSPAPDAEGDVKMEDR